MTRARAASAGPAPLVRFDRRLEPHVRVHHAMPGRTRLRLAPLTGRADLLEALARRLSARPGIVLVRDNAWSGALLVEHDPALSGEHIAALARDIWRRGLDPAAQSLDALHDWHALSANEVIAALDSAGGLSGAEANERLARIGENRLPTIPAVSGLKLVASQLQSAPVALLGASAALSLLTGGIGDAALTLGVIGLNAGIGAGTENWTQKLVRGLTRPADPDVAVLRDGAPASLPASRIAPGDWLILTPGTHVAADARLIEAAALFADESILTGESLAAEKHAGAALAAATPLGARQTMVYRNSVITSGAGLAVVVATGVSSEIGRVRALVAHAKAPAPPMEQALDRLGVRITIACIGASSLLALLLGLRGQSGAAIAKSAIALAVSAIPEGLPALGAATKAIAARAMAREGVFVRNINVVETAASLDVLCLDKTGTLTENKMRALAVETVSGLFDPSIGLAAPSEVAALAECAVLCSDARLAAGASPAQGSGTELALLDFAAGLGIDIEALHRRPRAGVMQRGASRLFMAVETEGGEDALTAVKGAPEQVLRLCAKDASGALLDDGARAVILKRNELMAGDGLRVLGVARGRHLQDIDDNGLTWLGLIGLADPLRPGAQAAIAALKRAGLRIIILTGDQAGTARKLAEDLGLSGDGALDVVDATALEGLDDAALTALARKTEVFARVSPAGKLAIIRALQADGHVVGMTGDGVNDGPALRAADLGIAMGRTGADVAREIADLVIADDDLAGLAAALRRGRAAEENLRRAVRFLLATNFSEVALLLAEAVQGPDALETPAQLLWLNLMTDVFPALGLASARPASDILERRPRAASDTLFGADDARAIGVEALRIAAPALITHLVGGARHGQGPRTRGLTFLSLAAHQLAHALRLRPGRPATDVLDRPIELGVLAGYALLAAPFAIAPLTRALRITAPRGLEMAMITGFSLAPLAVKLIAERARR